MKENKQKIVERSPVVVVMGHIDHGKSKLLDYIRKSNIVEKEVGNITQHLSAYEVIHQNEFGTKKKITFLDTPGHEAFSQMRERGAQIADIAILIISAEDSVKNQTIEALKAIKERGIPFVVAINKIDKTGANVEKTKNDLVENEVYLEGYGGDIPYAEISAKTGQGVDKLLDLIILVAEMEELKGDLSKPATGFVIESDLDPQRGISASLLIKDGILKKGMFVVVDDSISGTRIFENFLGKQIEKAFFSSPVRIIGFSSSLKFLGLRKVPRIGEKFYSFETKIEAEKLIKTNKRKSESNPDKRQIEKESDIKKDKKLVPIIIKTDVAGTIEAIEKEISKLNNDEIVLKIIRAGVGAINESDVSLAIADKNLIVMGFNVKVDANALDLSQKLNIPIKTFDIIYKITDWLKEELETRRTRKEVVEMTGKSKILKIFSKIKNKQVIGGKVLEGKLTSGTTFNIIRRENKIGEGKINRLEQNKIQIKEVNKNDEFGIMIESKIEIAPGDILETFVIIKK